MEKSPSIWALVANILNKQCRTADNGCFPTGVLGELLGNSHNKNLSYYAPCYRASGGPF